MDVLPPPGSHHFLPSLLTHIRTAAPGFPLEPALVQVLLLCIVSGNRHLILRTRDEDITLVSKLTALTLDAIFGQDVHRSKCSPASTNQTPSEFLRSHFFSLSPVSQSTDGNPSASHKHQHKHSSTSRTAPSTSVGTSRSGRLSRTASHQSESKLSITTLGRPHLHPEDADLKSTVNVDGFSHHHNFHSGAPTGTSLASSTTTHVRHTSGQSIETLKLPSALVVSGLELANLPSQKAVLRTLAERNIIVSDCGVFGHDQDGLTLALPDGFFMVYVCRSDPRERPLIYKYLLDMFAMSSSVDISAQTRLAMRQFRLFPSPSASIILSSPHTSPAAFPILHPLGSSSRPPTPPRPVASPVIPPAFLERLKHLCATHARIRPPLSIYLADLFSATRHYGPLDAMMLTVRARQDAEALACASRVLGTDRTGAELIKERAERSHDMDSITTYSHSHPSIASASSDALVEGFEVLETLDLASSSLHPSLASQPEQAVELDISEADIARMFPRVVSHRIRVRDSPFDEILSSAIRGATSFPGNASHDGETSHWERETVKDILVHILAEV